MVHRGFIFRDGTFPWSNPRGKRLGRDSEPLKPFGLRLQSLPPAKTIQRLLDKYQLLVVRNADFKEERELADYCEYLGRCRPQHQYVNDSRVSVIGNFLKERKFEQVAHYLLDWHQDLNFKENLPVNYVALYCVDPGEGEGVTDFMNSVMLYSSLGLGEKRRLAKLRAIDTMDALYRNVPDHGNSFGRDRDPLGRRRSRPLVKKQLWGKDFLDWSPLQCEFIDGLSEDEVEQLKVKLLSRGEPFVYSHLWESGDLVLSNNRKLVHRRSKSSPDSSRHHWRVQILGSSKDLAWGDIENVRT